MVSCYATLLLLAAASLLVVPSRQEQHHQSCPPSSDGGDDNDDGGEGRACVPPPWGAAGEKDDDDDDDDEYAAAGIAVVVVAEDDDERRRREEEPRFPEDFVHPCQDDDPRCPLWAREGECRFNSPYMLRACAGSCRTCQSPTTGGEEEEEEEEEGEASAACVDKEKLCGVWADEDGECWINPDCEVPPPNQFRIYFLFSSSPATHRPPFSVRQSPPSPPPALAFSLIYRHALPV